MQMRTVEGILAGFSEDAGIDDYYRGDALQIGGERIELVAWPEELHDAMESAVGKHVRLSLVKSGRWTWVAALACEGRVIEAKDRTSHKLVEMSVLESIAVVLGALLAALALATLVAVTGLFGPAATAITFVVVFFFGASLWRKRVTAARFRKATSALTPSFVQPA